jgi:hypothetical protein
MNAPRSLICLALLSSLGFAHAAASAPDRAPDKAGVDKTAGDACEKQVVETVRELRGREAQDVQFLGTRRAIAATAETDETGVKGEGRYKGSAGVISFTYSCTYNHGTGTASGVMLSEKNRPVAVVDRGAQAADLGNLSPEACERAAAASLKDKYPRVGRIVFGSDTRRLKPAPNDHTSLEGQGGVERAPGMNAVPFTYRCEFEPRSGKLVAVQTSD